MKNVPNNYIDEELGENIEEFHIANSCIECISLQSLAPNWYRDIKSKKDIDKIVRRLEDNRRNTNEALG